MNNRMATAVHLEVTSLQALIDEPVTISLSGLVPDGHIVGERARHQR